MRIAIPYPDRRSESPGKMRILSPQVAADSSRRRYGLMASLPLMLAVVQPAFGEGDPQKGARTYLNLCSPCHSVGPGRHMSGPSLSGIAGRKAGSVEGFTRYSKALVQSTLVWDGATLLDWITNPQALVPGSAMPVPEADAQARADIVAYLMAAQPATGPARTDIPKPFDKTIDLKSATPATKVAAITYCRDTYTLKMENGSTQQYWENNLRIKTDASSFGPPPGKPVLIPGGQQGDLRISHGHAQRGG